MAVDFGHDRQLRHDQLLQPLGESFQPRLPKAAQTPTCSRKIRLHAQKHLDFFVEAILTIQTDGDIESLLRFAADEEQLLVEFEACRHAPNTRTCPPLLNPSLRPAGVIRLVVSHHERGGRVKAFDQQGRLHSSKRGSPAREWRACRTEQPVAVGVQNRPWATALVVDGFESERNPVFRLHRRLVGMSSRSPRPRAHTTSPFGNGQKGLHLGVIVKRMAFVAEQPAMIHRRRNPHGSSAYHFQGKSTNCFCSLRDPTALTVGFAMGPMFPDE